MAISTQIQFRPLLVSGMLATVPADRADVILIDSEQPEAEQLVALWHETLHLLGLTCPEILAAVKAAAADIHCGLCSWRGPREKLLAGEACPKCRLVL